MRGGGNMGQVKIIFYIKEKLIFSIVNFEHLAAVVGVQNHVTNAVSGVWL